VLTEFAKWPKVAAFNGSAGMVDAHGRVKASEMSLPFPAHPSDVDFNSAASAGFKRHSSRCKAASVSIARVIGWTSLDITS
jgi:hypothetical protein